MEKWEKQWVKENWKMLIIGKFMRKYFSIEYELCFQSRNRSVICRRSIVGSTHLLCMKVNKNKKTNFKQGQTIDYRKENVWSSFDIVCVIGQVAAAKRQFHWNWQSYSEILVVTESRHCRLYCRETYQDTFCVCWNKKNN